MIQFLVRQRWRISQTYLLITPFIGIINTFLYFIIAVGVTDIFQLNELIIILLIISPLLLINLLGYFLDKVGYFKQESNKNLKDNTSEVIKLSSEYTAMMTAYYMKLSSSELEDKINSHSFKKWSSNDI